MLDVILVFACIRDDISSKQSGHAACKKTDFTVDLIIAIAMWCMGLTPKDPSMLFTF